MSELSSKNVLQFLENYKGFMLEEHKEEFEKFLEKYSSAELTDKFHFVDCPWANMENMCGPDTCACTYWRLAQEKIRKIMKLYERIQKESI